MSSDLTRNDPGLYSELYRAAELVLRSWPGAYEVDDLTQDLWIWYQTRPSVQLKFSEVPEHERIKLAAYHGRKLVGEYRRKTEVFTGNVEYSIDDAVALLAGKDKDVDRLCDLVDAMEYLRAHRPIHAETVHKRYGQRVPVKGDKSYEAQLTRAHKAVADELNRVYRVAQADSESREGPGSRTKGLTRNEEY